MAGHILSHLMSTKLYVGNIPYPATADELNDHFTSAGCVKLVDRLTERRTGRNRGFCFMEMESAEGAEIAVSRLNASEFQGRSLRVVLARPSDD
jgi:RNA recognition motif-containing protein